MKPAPFEYEAPATVDEAVAALAQHGDEAKVLAGGQSLVPMLNMRLARPAVLVDINRITPLDTLVEAGGQLAVGALCRQRALERWAAGHCPLVAEVMRWVSHMAIRNRGTVAGSIIHADPAAELPALLLCTDGAVTARRGGDERVVAARDLFQGPLTTALEPDELVTEVRFNLPPAGAGWGFAEVARRHGDFALAGAVAVLQRRADGRVANARLALFGVGGVPTLSEATASLVGEEPGLARLAAGARATAATLDTQDDLHATAAYRRRVAEVLATRVLAAAVERAATTGVAR